ncbi:helix-turn-helix domain-containing protein [Microbacterium horticulturae]|uniref:Helix-turn-helix domain-containing protein n=1 Tax=Microbacterium horticulturae TaxID=3028316 RepID=A0ABY8C492_9MICO|nr:PucR family transcriptional regulator [Microbacterium sp. KACC 23027]WEG09886.1 helix-turn-helix domain-containing protein [Microbacterium sp. KACC 23027]
MNKPNDSVDIMAINNHPAADMVHDDVDVPTRWPHRRRMPDLATLPLATQRTVTLAVDRLRESVDRWAELFLQVIREQLPGYAMLTDDEIRDSAHGLIDTEVAELTSLRVPDDALRGRLEGLAMRRASQGVSMGTLTRAYQIGSRELLAFMDDIAAEVDLPSGLLLAIHDSTWEFANEAASVFARVQRDLAAERARFDAERRAGFTRGLLGGTLPPEQLHLEAPLFSLDERVPYVALAMAQPGTDAEADAVRRAIASAVHLPPNRLMFAALGAFLGCIAPAVPAVLDGHLIGVGPRAPLERLHVSFDEAVIVFETAQHFGMSGAVALEQVGPRPLVLQASDVGDRLHDRHLGRLDPRTAADIMQTVRIYLDCDQRASDAAVRLTVHPNTVRYRVGRFEELTGLRLRRTDDLVTAWWLLHRVR